MPIIESVPSTLDIPGDIGTLAVQMNEPGTLILIGVFFDEPFDGSERFFGIVKDSASHSILCEVCPGAR
jgi:hypothetical protein